MKSIGQQLQLAARLHRATIAAEIEDLGLFPGQEQVLIALLEEPSRTVGELAAHLKVRPPTISKTLQRLSQQGLTERSDHESDARKSSIQLTKLGATKAVELVKRLETVEGKLTATLDAKEQRRLRKGLKRVIKTLGADPVVDDEDGEADSD